MSVFVDTSALYALLVEHDARHEEAAQIFDGLIDSEVLVTTNYVMVESTSLVHARHGRGPLRALAALGDVIEWIWVDEELHSLAFSRLSGRGRSGPSFVDLVNFEVMKQHDIDVAFAFDDDFVAEGYTLAVP